MAPPSTRSSAATARTCCCPTASTAGPGMTCWRGPISTARASCAWTSRLTRRSPADLLRAGLEPGRAVEVHADRVGVGRAVIGAIALRLGAVAHDELDAGRAHRDRQDLGVLADLVAQRVHDRAEVVLVDDPLRLRAAAALTGGVV